MPFFRTDFFLPYGYCDLWKPELVRLHLLSDALIALAYYAIALTLFSFIRKRRDLPFTWFVPLFSAFIVAGGTIHLMEIWTLWQPTYWLSGALKFITAVISLTTAMLLVPLVSKALALPNLAQLEAANQALQNEIIDRKQTKQSLSQLAAIVESSGDAMISKSLDGTITSWNAGAEKLFGYTAADVINRSITLLFPPDRVAELSQVLEQVKQGKTIESYETTRVRQDGQRIEIAATISPLKDATGQVIGAAKTARDITARKQAEAAIQQSEARYRAIVEDQTELVVRFKSDGTLTFVNDAYCRYFGMTREHLVGHRYEPTVLAEDRDRVNELLRSMNQGNPTVVVENRVVVGEDVRWTQWVNRALFDAQGQLCEIQAVGRDIHDLKQAEEALRQSDRRFRAIFNSMFQLIGLLTPDGILIEANQAALEFAGLTREAVINCPFWETYWWTISAATQAQLKTAIAHAATGQFIRYEVDILGVHGTVATIDFSLKPVRDETGNVVLLIPEGRDISDRKQTEEALRQSEARNRALIQAIPDLLIRMKHDGTYLDIQKTGNVLLLSASQVAIGNNIQSILPADKAQECMSYVQKALQTRKLQVYEYQLQIDGQLQFEEARIVPCGEDEVLVIVRDIRERKQVEEALRRYERIISATTDATVLLDRNYVYQSVNQAYLNWHNKQQDEVLGRSVSDLLPLDVYETVIKPRLDQCLAGQVVQYELWHDYPTLGRQFLSVTYDPYFDTNQILSGVVVSLRNITRLKQAEVELELQSLIVRNIAEGVCMVKVSDGIFVYTNPKFERMFGYDAGELVGQHVAIVNYEDRNTNSAALYEALARTILEPGEAVYDVHNVKKDGTPFWCQATTSVFEHPRYGAVFVVVQQDITERKQAEGQLHALSNRLMLALKSGAIGTWEWSVTANSLTWDDRMYELYGTTPDQFTNVYEAWANRLHPDDRPLAEAAIQRALAGEKDYEPEFRVRHPDGTIHYLKAYALVERNQSGAPQQMIGINYDITALKQTAEQIEASLKEKEVLLKEIHHRVKNNLGVVDGLLAMQSRRSQNADVIETLKESQNRIASIALVHEKLYSSDYLAKVDFVRYVADLTAHLFDSYNIHSNQIKLTTHIDAIPLDIDTAVPCGLIINELISNALKYAFSNIQTGEIQVTLQQQHDYDQNLLLIVRDNGIGLPQDFNLKQTKTLGMTLVKGLVKQLKGTLEVQSQQGATFIISLNKA